MRELDRRRDTVMTGLTYRHKADWGTLRTNISGDILGISNGIVVSLPTCMALKVTNGQSPGPWC